jgi:polyhydroxyalkanoate synthase subunit PhaC
VPSGVGHSEFTDEKDVIIVTAEASTDQTLNGKTTQTGSANGPATESAAKGPTSQNSAEAAAAPLDLFLPDATLSMLRRFGADSATARWALKLASNPGTVIRRVGQLTADLAAIAAGKSEIAPPRRDRRFADTAWTGNPMLHRTVQTYLALGKTAEGLLEDADLDWKDNTRLTFILTNLIAASAPSNNPFLNPLAWKAFIDTGGLSVVRGARAFAGDMASSPHIPKMVEPDAFTVGKDIGITPGAVVSRTDIYELIQYKPSTPTVHQYPLLMVPPMINKFYITDLAPGRSMLEYFVSQGYTVFVISWRNPTAKERDWDLNTYGGALVETMQTAREITKSPKVNVIGLCAGGILSSMVSAHLAATEQLDQISTLALGVTLLDMTRAGTTISLMSTGTADVSKLASRVKGYMDGSSLAEVFAWLRPDDLIWTYWVNNYLQGKTPPPFDILYWNADTTRMPAALHRDFINIGMSNGLVHRGQVQMLGTPVDLSKINLETYVVAGVDDHIAPWKAAYRATQLLGGTHRFVLSNSGHIAAMVNPPSNPKATFRIGPNENREYQQWLDEAETVQGSWWPDYTNWLDSRSGDMKEAPRRLGSTKHPALDPAPGTYVLER